MTGIGFLWHMLLYLVLRERDTRLYLCFDKHIPTDNGA